MSSENQTNIRFSLKETVWFQKGQEVKEVRSLSLNPDITIQQFDEYVQVKGVLTLEGNYTPDLADGGDYYSLRELAPSRLVEDVRALEDGSCELRHQFPVDISIPLTRIIDLENLCVSVETFDYQLTEKGCIQIAADLCISGLHDNRAVDHYYEQREQAQFTDYPYSSGYRSSNNDEENQEEREQEEQFQFFNQQPADLNEQNDDLYGSDWIQSLDNEAEEEVQTYPSQPTYLEVFQPQASEADNASEAVEYHEYDEYQEQSEEFEVEQQEEVYEAPNYEFNLESPDAPVAEFEGVYREEIVEKVEEAVEAEAEDDSVDQPNEVRGEFSINPSFLNNDVNTSDSLLSNVLNPPKPSFLPNDANTKPSFLTNDANAKSSFLPNDANAKPSFLTNDANAKPSFLPNDANARPSFLPNDASARPSFLNNDYTNQQNNAYNEYNVQRDLQNYEELYNRSVEQSYHPYANNQYQQAPYQYNQQQPYIQNPYPQVNQVNPYANDVRQTPPYYAEYYQAQVEEEIAHDAPILEQSEQVEQEEVTEVRSVKSDNLLSSLFTGEGKEESYSKLKLYLAQNGDTIESVAKKYNLQTQQLNRVNNLNDEFLSEGQIIYIPVTAIKQ